MADTTNWEEQLAKLAPDARKRVEEALRAGLEAELAAEALSPAARATEFSRGWFFSRAKPASLEALEEKGILQQSLNMDDAAFGKFAARLTQLKNLKDVK